MKPTVRIIKEENIKEPYKLPFKLNVEEESINHFTAALLKLANRVEPNTEDFEKLIRLIYNTGYNAGLKHMDQMHQLTDKNI